LVRGALYAAELMIGRVLGAPLSGAVIAAGLIIIAIQPAGAGAEDCRVEGDLTDAGATCTRSAKEVRDLVHSGDGHSYTVEAVCPGEYVFCNPGSLECRPPQEFYWLLRDGKSIGTVCLTPRDATELGEISPGQVLREFRRLSWPSAELVIQPPDHRTMVNLATLFSTPSARTQTQTVTLLGQRVTIEATQTSYLWHSDVAGDTWETTDPGQSYQPGDDPEQLNHYVYLDADVTVHPSVDVVYSGRYRVGNGAWQDIPDTLTVAGDTQPLEVTQAAPVLN
jgi:hypothetical protein